MKNIFAIVLMAAISLAFAQEAVRGQRNIHSTWIYWDPGSGDTDSTLKIVINNDSVRADSAGTWKLITGTADSCSYPFYLTDMSGSLSPIWLQVISPLIQPNRVDSNSIAFRVETREMLSIRRGNSHIKQWDRWIPQDKEIGDSNLTIVDSIYTVDADTIGTKSRQKLRFHVSGVQARLCPLIPAAASAGETDTTFYDSLYYIGR